MVMSITTYVTRFIQTLHMCTQWQRTFFIVSSKFILVYNWYIFIPSKRLYIAIVSKTSRLYSFQPKCVLLPHLSVAMNFNRSQCNVISFAWSQCNVISCSNTRILTVYNTISMKDFLNQTLASYVPDSTENKFGPLTIKHLPTPMQELM